MHLGVFLFAFLLSWIFNLYLSYRVEYMLICLRAIWMFCASFPIELLVFFLINLQEFWFIREIIFLFEIWVANHNYHLTSLKSTFKVFFFSFTILVILLELLSFCYFLYLIWLLTSVIALFLLSYLFNPVSLIYDLLFL